MKKKILFINGSLRTGGVRRSLVNLLNNIDYSKFQVDLLLFYQGGELFEEIPKEVNLIEGNIFLKLIGMSFKEVIASGNIFNIIFRFIISVSSRIFKNKYLFRLIFSTHKINKYYDIGIAYSHNIGEHGLYGGIYQYLIWNTNINKKIGWIHTDYGMLKNDLMWEAKLFSMLDGIVNISKSNQKSFLSFMPEYKDKCFVVHNSIIAWKIKNMSKKQIPDLEIKGCKYIGVSVARLDDNKAIDRVINAVADLYSEGQKLGWIIVGNGPNMQALKNLVRDKNLVERIIFVGNKKNPYPYILKANLLCVSSIFEGMPMVVEEAFALGKPVISTEYAAVSERITNEENGLIVENSDDGIYEGLKKWIECPTIRERCIVNAKASMNLTETSLIEFENMIEVLSSNESKKKIQD